MEQPRTEPGPGHVQLAAQSTAAAGSPLLPAAAAAAAAKGLNDVMQQGGSATRKIMSGMRYTFRNSWQMHSIQKHVWFTKMRYVS
jgi:hypothetical protein